jgi:YD repeat-containing protein
LGYDALDRLTHVEIDGAIYEYIYDAFNRRITKKTLSETIHYLWQGKNEIGSSQEELPYSVMALVQK